MIPFLGPDGKTKVTIEYANDRLVRLDTVVVSGQHAHGVDIAQLLSAVSEHVVEPMVADLAIETAGHRLLVNPTGRFEIGGLMGDAGVTGRKIIVDSYGGMARHGGAAFSGKDPSKVDRSGASALRWIAKNIVAAGLACRCELQSPTRSARPARSACSSKRFGTEQVDPARITAQVEKVFDLRPAAIIRDLALRRPICRRTRPTGTSAGSSRSSPGSEPIGPPRFSKRSAKPGSRSSGWPAHCPPAEYVGVHVPDVLATSHAGVEHGPELADASVVGRRGDRRQNRGGQPRPRRQLYHGRDVFARDDEQVDGGDGVEVGEGDGVLVGGDHVRLGRAGGDGAEQALAVHRALRLR
jgi:hypothetical protein